MDACVWLKKVVNFVCVLVFFLRGKPSFSNKDAKPLDKYSKSPLDPLRHRENLDTLRRCTV